MRSSVCLTVTGLLRRGVNHLPSFQPGRQIRTLSHHLIPAVVVPAERGSVASALPMLVSSSNKWEGCIRKGVWCKSLSQTKNHTQEYCNYDTVPDGVPGVVSVWRAISIEEEVSLQVACVVMSWIVVGDDPCWDAKASEDCKGVKYVKATLFIQAVVPAEFQSVSWMGHSLIWSVVQTNKMVA